MNQKLSVPDYRPLELMLDNRITKSDFDDFIGVWPNFMPRPLCEELIGYANSVYDTACIEVPSATTQHNPNAEIAFNSSQQYGGDLNRKDYAFLLNFSICLMVKQKLNFCIREEESNLLQELSLFGHLGLHIHIKAILC